MKRLGLVLAALILSAGSYAWVTAPIPATPGTLISTSLGEWKVLPE